MSIEQEDLYKVVQQSFPDAKIIITDTVGDKDHYLIEITDSIFSQQNKIQQHRIVHKALGSILNHQLHAIEIKTSGT